MNVHGELGRKITNIAERESKEFRMLKGRQMLWMIEQHMNTSGTDQCLLGVKDLFNVELKGDNVEGLVNEWEWV